MGLDVPGHWTDLAEEDNKRFNADHCVIGYLVARHWHLPDFICNAIRHHHDLRQMGINHAARTMVAILLLASRLYDIDRRMENDEWPDVAAAVAKNSACMPMRCRNSWTKCSIHSTTRGVDGDGDASRSVGGRLRRDLRVSAGRCRRGTTSASTSVVAGPTIAAASRSITKTRRATPRHGPSGTSSSRQSALQRACRARHAARRPRRDHDAAAPADRDCPRRHLPDGAVAVPLSHLFGPDALEYRLADAGVHVAIVDDATLPKLLEIRDRLPDLRHVIGVDIAPETAATAGVRRWQDVLEHASPRYVPVATRADDPALIIYTSGTTGNPKAR